MVTMERLGDGGGGEEHPIQVVAVFTQGLAGGEFLGDTPFLALVIPLEVDVQIDTLAGAVVGGAEDIRILGNLPAIPPVVIHEEVFIG